MRKLAILTAVALLGPLLMLQSAAGALDVAGVKSLRSDGASLSESTATWWQWNLAIPVPANPSFDVTGTNCHVRQSGGVFFLAGSATFEPVTRTCALPSKTPILFPLINVECSNVEAPPFFGATDPERAACANAIIDDVGRDTLVLLVDGRSVASEIDRVQSPPFQFSMPAHQNILFLDGITRGRSASDGYWALLPGLSKGQHTLHFEAALVSGDFAGLAQDVTYLLNVS
jgi:hypothetical protein